MNTPEDIIRELVHQRDTGGYISILAWRLTETIPNINTSHRIMNAVYNNQSLEECLAITGLKADPKKSPRQTTPSPEESLLNFVEEGV